MTDQQAGGRVSRLDFVATKRSLESVEPTRPTRTLRSKTETPTGDVLRMATTIRQRLTK